MKNIVQLLKLYDIPKVGITYVNLGFFNPIYWLDSSKFFLPYLESDITDKCNLKCAACYHFHNFSLTEDFYPIKDFRRDIRRVAQKCDVLTFRLMGGEILLLKNLDEYIKTVRQYLPNTNLRILSNGLLIPSLPQRILDVIRENNVAVYISIYPPTVKIFDKIKETLEANKILYGFDEPSLIENFHAILTLNGNNDALKARKICGNEVCRSMYKGMIYKCPLDAFSHKFVQKFGIEGFAASTGVDIYSQSFPALIPLLDGDIEMCHWCSERPARKITWEPTNNPKLEDWLADPDELKIFS